MANQYISAFTQTWNNGATTYNGIKMNVTDSASASDSKLIDLQVGGTSQFNVSKAGVLTTVGAVKPSANDGAALGVSGTAWADLFLASGAVINFLAGDVTITHSANLLAFASASGGYTFDTLLTVGHTANLSIGGNADNLEVMGTTAATGGIALGMFNATAGTGAHFDFYRSKNAAVGSATVVASGDNLGSLNWFGAQQTGTFATQTMAAQIRAEVDGTVTSGGSGDMPGRLVFSTTADAGSAVTDRLILDAAGILKPNANDGVALGTSSLGFSDLFLASGAVINWNGGDVTLTHGTNRLDFAGGSSGYSFDALIYPVTDDGAPLGSTARQWSDLFLASGAVVNFNAGDVTLTHASNALTVAGGDLLVTTAGTAATSVVTIDGTQTLGNKTLTSVVLNTGVSGTAVADQTAMEAGASTSLIVTPGRQHFHPSAAKFWGYVTVSGGTPTLQTSYNVTSITDTGTGLLTVTIATDFSSANWSAWVTGNESTQYPTWTTNTKAVGSILFQSTYRAAGTTDTFIDPDSWDFGGFGDI